MKNPFEQPPYRHDFNPAQGKDPCPSLNLNLMMPRKDVNSMQDAGSSLAPSERPLHQFIQVTPPESTKT